MKELDISFVRSQFPGLSGEWAFFDNAGGTQPAKQVGDRIQDYLYNTNVQLGASYEISQLSTQRVAEAQQTWARVINAADPVEVVFGSSTTMLLQSLSRSMVQTLQPGDEVIVTNCDHEANIGPWLMMQKHGIEVKSWKVNPDTLHLELDELERIMTEKTRLVAFTHTSNILGTINPVKTITEFVHDRGAMVCVDAVAYAPHRMVDVQTLDVDFYVFSLYKVYGPHYSVLYGKKKHLDKLPGINHFFIGNEEIPYKLQPGNVNYELSYGLLGITDYFDRLYAHHYGNGHEKLLNRLHGVYELIESHEEHLSHLFVDFLKSKKNVRIIGEPMAEGSLRVPTFSFIVKERKSSEIPLLVDPYKIGIRWGDFYARRLIDDLGLSDQNGVVRVSMVHYNSADEVNRLISILDTII
ncbi:MAG: cysteine desulfurase-like protein [Bacteroidetes bacterium]|nr:cysteine desulfurase-like protein [Bacteroidota bacterium]